MAGVDRGSASSKADAIVATVEVSVLWIIMGLFGLYILFLIVSKAQFDDVHQVLQEATLQNVSIGTSGSRGLINSATLAFKVSSRSHNDVNFSKLRIAAVYNNIALGGADGIPFRQPLQTTRYYEVALQVSNFTVPLGTATQLQNDVERGLVPLRIVVNTKASYLWGWRAWLFGEDLGTDDYCDIHIDLHNSNVQAQNCEWYLQLYNEK